MGGGETGAPDRDGSPLPMADGNRLLDGLAPCDAARLRPFLESLRLASGQVLGETGEDLPWAFFPCGPAVLSLVVVSDGRHAVEALSVGSEGMLGPDLTTLAGLGRVLVQMSGPALRIAAAPLAAACAESPGLRASLALHDRLLLMRAVQASVCAALHPVEARVSRWLLAAFERVGRPDLPVTQEALAELLGVRRTTVTRVIAQLCDKGVIQHRRSRVIVCDPAGLARTACGCQASLAERLRVIAPALQRRPQASPGLPPA